jgi:hypothetical protein
VDGNEEEILHKTMFGSFLPPVVCRRSHVLFTLCSVRLYLQLFVGGLLSYLCLFAYTRSGVGHTLCCVFLRLVCPMLQVFLDCPFLIVRSVFSNVYLMQTLCCLVTTVLLCNIKLIIYFY